MSDDLQKRIEELEAENARLRRWERFFRGEHKLLGYLAALFLIGPRLPTALKKWVAARERGESVWSEETTELGTAVVRRLARVGLIGLVVSILTVGGLAWQGYLLSQQNEEMRQQTRDIQATVELQRCRDGRIRRSQITNRFLGFDYDFEHFFRDMMEHQQCCDGEGGIPGVEYARFASRFLVLSAETHAEYTDEETLDALEEYRRLAFARFEALEPEMEVERHELTVDLLASRVAVSGLLVLDPLPLMPLTE